MTGKLSIIFTKTTEGVYVTYRNSDGKLGLCKSSYGMNWKDPVVLTNGEVVQDVSIWHDEKGNTNVDVVLTLTEAK